jgi:hypothetical protein
MYMLLTPLTEDNVGTSIEEIIESLAEFGCEAVLSVDHAGVHNVFATAKDLTTIENLCNTVDLEGCVVNYNEVYDQEEKVL